MKGQAGNLTQMSLSPDPRVFNQYTPYPRCPISNFRGPQSFAEPVWKLYQD